MMRRSCFLLFGHFAKEHHDAFFGSFRNHAEPAMQRPGVENLEIPGKSLLHRPTVNLLGFRPFQGRELIPDHLAQKPMFRIDNLRSAPVQQGKPPVPIQRMNSIGGQFHHLLQPVGRLLLSPFRLRRAEMSLK